MAKLKNKKEITSGNLLLIVATLEFDEMTPEVAWSILSGLNFGGKVLIVECDRNRVWRSIVLFRYTPKVLTVQLVYRSPDKWDNLREACIADSNNILELIVQVLHDNDVDGNSKVVQTPEGDPVKPEPIRRDDTQRDRQGGQAGDQGRGGQRDRQGGRQPGAQGGAAGGT